MVTTNALLVCVCCFLFTCANALRTPSQPFVKTPIGTIYGRWTAYSQEYLGTNAHNANTPHSVHTPLNSNKHTQNAITLNKRTSRI